jgi:hypothetical protein
VTLASLKEAIQKYNAALDPVMFVESTPIGVDGWVKDVLLRLPPMDEASTRDTLDAIQQHVFNTTYKAYVMPLPAATPAPSSDKLDLNVSIPEVKKWLFEDGEPLTSMYGGEITAEQVLQSQRSGIFFSKERSLVIWSIDRNKPISDYIVEARQFALDSDIIVGAVNTGTQLLIVGRERIIPVEVLPPLRTETILQLASVKDDELEQSYERTNIFAGKFNGEDDWAPIYLSNALIDTEYGSLLNITDQLLKRWSMNGLIEYQNFKYPNPQSWGKDWCFNEPLVIEAGATNLTFNWNTQGVGYTTKIGGREFFALNRSGSLPTSYLEGDDQKPNYTSYEETGYKCFAKFGDPNLARVVQYAALYQIFQKFHVQKALNFTQREVSLEANDDVLTKEALRVLKLYVEPTLEQVGEINRSLSLSEQRRFRRDAAIFAEVKSTYPRDGLWTLAYRITHQVTPAELRRSEDIREKYNSLTPAQRRNLFTPLSVDPYGLMLDVYHLRVWTAAYNAYVQFISNPTHADVNLSVELFKKLGDTNLSDLKDRYAAQFQSSGGTWIHTPSIVISHALGELSGGTGGHNLSAETTSFEVAAEVPRGTVRTRRSGNRITFVVNPEDAGKIPTLVRRAAFLSKGGELTPFRQTHIQQSLQTAMNDVPPPRPPRGKNDALAMSADPPHLPPPGGPGQPPPPQPPGRGFDGGNGGGWRPELIPVVIPDEARSAAKYGDVAFLVKKQSKPEGFEYTITTDDGKVVKAHSTPSAIDAVTALGKNAARDNPKVAFHLDGFTPDEAQGFLYNASLRVKNERLTSFVRDGAEPGSYRAKAADYNLPGVEMGGHSLKQIAGGRYNGLYELQINFNVPTQAAARPPLKVRLQMLYRQAIAEPTVANVKSAIRTFFGRPVAADSNMNAVIVDLANELRALNPDAKNIMTVWEEDTSGVIIVEMRLPEDDDGDLREKGVSE